MPGSLILTKIVNRNLGGMSKQSEAVKKWRKVTKQRIVESMGGGCVVCGYSRCNNALDLHHLDPLKKDIAIGAIRSNPRKWTLIVEELRKCVLLCKICHAEIHDGIAQLPGFLPTFDERFLNYKVKRDIVFEPCLFCKKEKMNFNTYCSLECSGRAHRRIAWDGLDLVELLESFGSIVGVANHLNCSDNAVRKRMKKLKMLP